MTEVRDWETTRRIFRRIAASEGVARVAPQIPADRVTVYRIISGEHEKPTRAVRAGIERIVTEHQQEE